LWAPPCRELLLTPQVLARAAELAEKHPQLADILGKVANGVAVEGMESLASVLVDTTDLLVDEMPPDTVVLLCDPERVRARAAEVLRTGEEFLQAAWAGAASGGKAPIDLSSAALRPLGDVRADALSLGLAWWSVSHLRRLLSLMVRTSRRTAMCWSSMRSRCRRTAEIPKRWSRM